MRNRILFAVSVLFVVAAFFACTHKPFPVPKVPTDSTNYGNYPTEVGKIIITRCASGCHDAANAPANGSLRLDSWEQMFEGGPNGSVVVPYSPEFSSLVYFINDSFDKHLPTGIPLMPYNSSPLTSVEYYTIKNWIAKGAPDRKGNIPFSSNTATRQKVYMTQQGCDLLGVIDAEKKVVMRYINIGDNSSPESPHSVRVDKDGKYAYVCFYQGTFVQKIDCATDEVVDKVDIGAGQWQALYLSDDGTKLAVTDLNGGKMQLIETNPMQKQAGGLIGGLKSLHGVHANANFDVFYVTNQFSNYIYKIDLNTGIEKISLDGNIPADLPGPNPHEIIASPDGTKYFVTCEGTNDVRVIDAATDSMIKIIPVGKKPQEMALSIIPGKPYLFVTCMEDDVVSIPYKGTVYAINYNDYSKNVLSEKFAQPHGIAVDNKNGLVYVANRRVSSGPAPHHSTKCGGPIPPGYYLIYDINSLSPYILPGKSSTRTYEVTPDPYGVDIRFKGL
jgi:YVTN family beta-propeller protein